MLFRSNRQQFLAGYPLDESSTTDDRPFFFHTTRLRDQMQVAFGRSMLFGNGLSALMTLMAISAALVVIFVIGPLIIGGERPGGNEGATAKLPIEFAGYCNPGPARTPISQFSEKTIQAAKKKAEHWKKLCEKYRPLVEQTQAQARAAS